MTPDYIQRFAGIGRLYGERGLNHLSQSHFMVVGLGGVGSWAAEALVRSGVGKLTLIDGDTVCISNTNRQLHAITTNYNQRKTVAIAQRAQSINPEIQIQTKETFAGRNNVGDLLADFNGVIIDAIDALSPKCCLINEAYHKKIPLVSVGGCAGRLDITRIKVTDLTASRDDPLLMLVRKRLRQNFGFPRKGNFNISAVWSDEPFIQPTDCADLPGGEIPEGEDLHPNCEWGYGTAAHLSGSFGLAAAGEAIRLSLLAMQK